MFAQWALARRKATRDAGWERVPVEDGVELAYTQRGSGQPVVLVPGWTMSGEVFEHQLEGLGASFRVVTFDPRSQGRSSRTPTGNSYPQHGRDLVALLATLALEDVHLVGWSYGGLACYAAIAQSGTGRIRSLTVLDQPPTPLATGAEGEWAEETLDGFLEEFVGPVVSDPEAFAAEFAEWLVARELTPQELQWLAGMHLATPRHATESLLVSAMFSDYTELAGSLGSRIPFANVIRRDCLDLAEPWLRKHAPESVVWSMASHFGFWERPTEFNERLVEFLFRVLGSAKLLGISVQVWIVVIAFILAAVFMRHHPTGRRIYAMGGNPAAARAAGVNTLRLTIGVFVVGALIAGVAGLMLTGRIASVTANQGDGMIFTVFAAAVIGGISLNGGRGTMLGAATGVLLLGIIQNILTLSNVPSFWINAVYGVIILGALVFGQLTSKRGKRAG